MKTVNDVLYPIDAALAWAALLFKLPSLRRGRREPAGVALCLAFAFIATTFTLVIPPVYATVDDLIGTKNIAVLISQCCVICYTVSIQLMLLFWAYPATDAWRRARWRLIVGVLVLPCMVTLFLLADANDQRTRDFVAHYAGLPVYSVYLLLYLSAYMVGRVDIIRLGLHYAPVAGRPWLRRGLYLTCVGGTLGLVYGVARAADIVGARLGADPHQWEILAQVGAGGGVIFTITGLTIPTWGPYVSRALRWLRRHHDYRSLYPLWHALVTASPQIALDPPRSRRLDHWDPRDLQFRLTRRVVEIRDGMLGLRPYFDDNVATIARSLGEQAGIEGDDLVAAIEASLLRSALDSMAAGESMQPRRAADHEPTGAEDVVGETAYLVKVAHAFDVSPIVATAVRTADSRRRTAANAASSRSTR
ncbi:MAB_1171c family putative transporter [Phytohabitans kaempferiae]|uniref:MAB_1171c family putative transporter n=1 Tax=Phytohabitans kaempferiae TaxID=1620943 RepID=A0ABV6MAB9_9ACTN